MASPDALCAGVTAMRDARDETLDAITRKIARRLLPLLVACYFVAYLDRVNLGFAAREMNRDLGFSPLVYGWGSGVFFIGYALLEVPSNYVLHRIGARIWISRIMVSWGVVSMAMALVAGEKSFYVTRLLLGAAEAGFAPGLVLYFTYWIPAAQRARILALLLFALPISTVVGAPISGFVLTYADGLFGLQGWQWLFVIEGAPAILLGLMVFAFLTDRPEDAHWLSAAERQKLLQTLEKEDAARRGDDDEAIWPALGDMRTLGLGAAYFGLVLALYGLNLWLPQIVADWGLTPIRMGFATAIPFFWGAVAMFFWSRHADRRGEPLRYAIFAAATASVGLLAASVAPSHAAALAALSLAVVGVMAALPTFWASVTLEMTGTRAALTIALVNSIGNLAGFAGPYFVGWIKTVTGDYVWAMAALALGPLAAILLLARLGGRRGAEAERPALAGDGRG
jgi:ACS family tartrate transporter-like MFS transporter